MSKSKRERFERLNTRFGEKYKLDGKAVGHIRSAVITEKLTKEQLITRLEEKRKGAGIAINDLEKRVTRYTDMIEFLEKATDEQFKDLTNPNPPKMENNDEESA